MSDFACLINLTGIYPVCHTALFPSNDVSHEEKKLLTVNKQEKIQQVFSLNKPQLQ
jgi:hypothetical protein